MYTVLYRPILDFGERSALLELRLGILSRDDCLIVIVELRSLFFRIILVRGSKHMHELRGGKLLICLSK